MPSKITSWITQHDHLAVLHITSTDPRRAGCEDNAVFEADLVPMLSVYEWRTRSGRIENQYSKSLLSIIADVRGLGTIQKEPNCDFTRDNLVKRSSGVGLDNITSYKLAHPEWRSVISKAHAKRRELTYFPPMKYRNRNEWTVLNIQLVDGGNIDIKINKWLVSKIPTKLVFRPMRRTNMLFLPPNEQQAKRRRCENDRRHGKALTSYILESIGSYDVPSTRMQDRLDYRVTEDGDFVGSTNPKNRFIDTEAGVVLEITIPANHRRKMWEHPPKHVTPQQEYIQVTEEAKAYYLLSETIADAARDTLWNTDEADAYGYVEGKRTQLKKFVCENSGTPVENITIPSRTSKAYEKAINGTDKLSMKRRAYFENLTPDEKTTANQMYTKARFVSRRKIHTDKIIHIPELNVTAQDLRIESIRIGGSNE